MSNSTAKNASLALNKYNRTFKEPKYNFARFGIKGKDAKNEGKRANFGEYELKYQPKEEENGEENTDKNQLDHLKRLEFEAELRIDAE